MNSLGQILEKIFRDPKYRSYFIEGLISGVWNRAVGAQIAAVAKPLSYENGVLQVRVESAAWRNELSMMSEEIIQKLNQHIGRDEIIQIVFR